MMLNQVERVFKERGRDVLPKLPKVPLRSNASAPLSIPCSVTLAQAGRFGVTHEGLQLAGRSSKASTTVPAVCLAPIENRRGVLPLNSQNQLKMHGTEHAYRNNRARYIQAISLLVSLFIAPASGKKEPSGLGWVGFQIRPFKR